VLDEAAAYELANEIDLDALAWCPLCLLELLRSYRERGMPSWRGRRAATKMYYTYSTLPDV
jgi:hypothetical protein